MANHSRIGYHLYMMSIGYDLKYSRRFVVTYGFIQLGEKERKLATLRLLIRENRMNHKSIRKRSIDHI